MSAQPNGGRCVWLHGALVVGLVLLSGCRAAAPPKGPEFKVRLGGDSLEYVFVPPGVFLMGCVPGDSRCNEWEQDPAEKVVIERGVWMGRTEVPLEAYQRFATQTGRGMPPSAALIAPGHPITRVNWDDAVSYCQWAGGRVPTEAEWEYAARAGHPGWIYPWGDDKKPLVDGKPRANVPDQARARAEPNLPPGWFSAGYDDGFAGSAPVGSFPANDFGLFDMGGNVREWCQTSFRKSYNDSEDPQPPGGVARDSSFYSGGGALRLASREPFTPNDWQMTDVGFRCVLDDEP